MSKEGQINDLLIEYQAASSKDQNYKYDPKYSHIAVVHRNAGALDGALSLDFVDEVAIET